jgi:hypothetical protein
MGGEITGFDPIPGELEKATLRTPGGAFAESPSFYHYYFRPALSLGTIGV